MEDNYFTCTLGQAVHHPKTKAGSISEFLELQAEQYAQRPACGFPGLGEKETCVLSFLELNEQSKGTARGLVSLVPELKGSLGQGRTAALLAHSHSLFLKVWLGLIRLGFTVLLLAPQLDRASIDQLCAARDVEYLFHDTDHANKAMEVKVLTRVNLESNEFASVQRGDADVEIQIARGGKVSAVPYLHHSSGTSSGKPKVITQTNAAAFAALPSIDSSPGAATFSSTPLYHGGVADCFRAWTSGQMIWLFPGGDKPITAHTVLACLSVADERSSNNATVPVKYFSSVPYVLRDLAANHEGIDTLRRMDIVGVGGAAFPTTLGQKLVSEGVNLVSRYGSAECGFLLSSYRDFRNDSDWDYLRSDTGAEHLSFEPQSSGLFELVVKPGWPHMAKINREDGSYATADLLERHPIKPNAWRYHSRADAQITLVNGKKFDPEPIESAIVSKCKLDHVSDVLVFGDGESYPGALIFSRKGSDTSPESLLEQIWPTVADVNQQNPSHARLSRGNLMVIFHGDGNDSSLEKSSKGTILRTKAYERYHDRMSQVYNGYAVDSDLGCPVNNKSELIVALTCVVERTTSKRLAAHEDFFEQGVDSLACMQIRQALQRLVVSLQQRYRDDAREGVNEDRGSLQAPGLEISPWYLNHGELPSNLLYDCGTIEGLAGFLLGQSKPGQGNDLRLMKELASKHSNFSIPSIPAESSPKPKEDGLVVLLTGATGALGTHLLDVYRSRSEVKRIYCLLRASDTLMASQRVDKALKSKAREGLEPTGKVVCIPCNLADAKLGMDESILGVMRSTVDLIIHAAWAVNFTLTLKSFEFYLASLQNLLNLGFAAAQATSGYLPDHCLQKRRVRFAFCSSIASVSSSSSLPVAEKVSDDPSDASPLGYSRSKWVAESICENAHRTAQGEGVPFDVEIYRIGQLCGDTEHGIWNRTEAWPLMLSTSDVVRCLPNLLDEKLNWLPLDIAANAIREITLKKCVQENSRTEVPVYHILNPHSWPSWTDMLRWLQEKEEGRFEIVSAAAWLEALERYLTASHLNHPSHKLLDLWKDRYLSRAEKVKMKPEFAVMAAASASGTMKAVNPVSRELVEKMWTWIRESIGDSAGADSEVARS